MKQTINLHQFREGFRLHERENFSYEGLEVLFDWIEQLDNDTGQDSEFDVIGLCCDFSEDTPEEIQRAYNIDHDIEDESSLTDQVRQYLQDEGHYVGETETSFIYFTH